MFFASTGSGLLMLTKNATSFVFFAKNASKFYIAFNQRAIARKRFFIKYILKKKKKKNAISRNFFFPIDQTNIK